MSYHLLITVDVEDWFQVENFKKCIPFSSWPSRELRVEKNTYRLLDLFDSFNGQQATDNGQNNKIQATFFILGWIAERLPNLVREIHARGHEVASHGYNHNFCNEQSHDDLKKDLTDSKKLLEDIIGESVFGYRAPNFSISNDVIRIIEECGYLYDSSYNSFSMHGRYGKLNFSSNGTKGIAIQNPVSRSQHQASRNQHPETSIQDLESRIQQPASSNQYLESQHPSFYELPISNLKLKIMNYELPWGGGGYFRLIPFPLFKMGVESILAQEKVYLFYIHSWEIDPDQPRISQASAFLKFRHYINLSRTHSKLLKLIGSFQQNRYITCKQYISELEN